MTVEVAQRGLRIAVAVGGCRIEEIGEDFDSALVEEGDYGQDSGAALVVRESA